MKFRLKARVSRTDERTLHDALEGLSAECSVNRAGDDFTVEGGIEGGSAAELNRNLLSALRKVNRRTTLRSEWISSDNTVERFFDYVIKVSTRN